MSQRTVSLASLLALAVVCLPLRADEDAFARELKSAADQMSSVVRERVDRRTSSLMGQDLKRLTAEVGALLIQKNEELRLKKMPIERRIPILRDLYLQQMRKIHDIPEDGESIVKYHERNQTLHHYHYVISGGGFSGSGGGGTFVGNLGVLLKLHTIQTNDPFARELKDAFRSLERRWYTFRGKHHRRIARTIGPLQLMSPSGSGGSGASPLSSFLTGAAPASVSPIELRRGIETIIEDIDHELTKLDVELAEQNLTPEKRAEKLRGRFFEVLQKVDMLAPMIQFDKDAVQIRFFDPAGAPLLDAGGAPIAFEFPPALLTALNMQAMKQAAKRRLQLLIGGGAALLLLLIGGVYLGMKLTAAKEA